MNNTYIVCLGYREDLGSGIECDCSYGANFSCQQCVKNGGSLDPRGEQNETN